MKTFVEFAVSLTILLQAMDAKHKPWEKVKKTPEIPNTDVTLPLGGNSFLN